MIALRQEKTTGTQGFFQVSRYPSPQKTKSHQKFPLKINGWEDVIPLEDVSPTENHGFSIAKLLLPNNWKQ